MTQEVDREAQVVVIASDTLASVADHWNLGVADLVLATAQRRANRDEDWLMGACAAARARSIFWGRHGAIEVERSIRMPELIARHLRAWNGGTHPWGTVKGHTDYLADTCDGGAKWFRDVLDRLPLEPWDAWRKKAGSA